MVKKNQTCSLLVLPRIYCIILSTTPDGGETNETNHCFAAELPAAVFAGRLRRTKYKVCTGKLLMTLELLPDKAVDLAYKAIVR